MSSFKDTLQLCKRRAGFRTDVDMTDIATEKVAKELGLSKEALLGAIAKAPFSLAARGVEKAVSYPFSSLKNLGNTAMAGFMGHQALGEAAKYRNLVKRKFPRPPKGVGVHD